MISRAGFLPLRYRRKARMIFAASTEYAEIDSRGKVRIPEKFLKQLGWQPGNLEVSVEEGYVHYHKTGS
jgi:bifunctional DNA-binding transcriptional regulator/antitoxin component of YhaV-PrlF toxin-antitoxin module